MNKKGKVAVVLAAVFLVTTAYAQGAPWYLWQSKIDGKTFCLQTSPGEGWERVGGPFKDSRCRTPS